MSLPIRWRRSLQESTRYRLSRPRNRPSRWSLKKRRSRMRSRSRSTCSRIPIGWSVARPPSRSGKWVMSVAWNRCVMRCATVTGKLGKFRDERVLDPLMLQLRNDEFKDDAVNALVDLGEPALSRLINALKDKDE